MVWNILWGFVYVYLFVSIYCAGDSSGCVILNGRIIIEK
jgi:hypothetical protein